MQYLHQSTDIWWHYNWPLTFGRCLGRLFGISLRLRWRQKLQNVNAVMHLKTRWAALLADVRVCSLSTFQAQKLYTLCESVSGKKDQNVLMIFSIKLRRLWWTLVHRFLDKFSAKLSKRLTLSVTFVADFDDMNRHALCRPVLAYYQFWCCDSDLRILQGEVATLISWGNHSLPRCMECRRGLAMRILSVRLNAA